MLNKKAIAALAAGATLLSGMAFAAPAFAETPKCTPVAADKLADLKAAVSKATRAVNEAQYKLDDDQPDFDKASKELADAKVQEANVKHFADLEKTATQEFNDYKAAHAGDTTSAEYLAAQLKETQAKEATKKALKDAKAALKSANDFADLAAVTAFVGGKKTAFDTARTKHLDLQSALDEAKGKLDAAQKALDKAQCKAAPTPDPTPDPNPTPNPTPLPDVPNIPLFGLSDAQVRALTRLENTYVVLKKDQSAFEFLHSEYLKSEAAYKSALAKYQAADNEYLAAQQKANDLKAAGKEDTDAYKAARNEEQAAGARKTAAQANYDDAAADFLAKTKAVNAAADKFNADLVLYRNAYNNAVAVRADVSGFPKPNDVAKAPTFGVPNQVKEAAKKAEAKKADAKKSAAPLAKTGAAVALAAVAASVLAGVGAALRKIRH